MPPVEWLKRFFADRQLAAPDARPLYRYRMRNAECGFIPKTYQNSQIHTIFGIWSPRWLGSSVSINGTTPPLLRPSRTFMAG